MVCSRSNDQYSDFELKKAFQMEIYKSPPRKYLNYPPMRASGKSAGERRKRDMQAFWIFVIQNDSLDSF